jgi:hypothetical protein
MPSKSISYSFSIKSCIQKLVIGCNPQHSRRMLSIFQINIALRYV